MYNQVLVRYFQEPLIYFELLVKYFQVLSSTFKFLFQLIVKNFRIFVSITYQVLAKYSK